MPDEPRPRHIRASCALADNVHSNPGPGRALPIFVTSRYVEALDAAIDIWCSGPKGFLLDRVAQRACARPRLLVLQRRAARRRRDHHRRAGNRSARHDLGRHSSTTSACTSTGTPSTGGTTRRSRGSATRTCGRRASRSTTAKQPNKSTDDQGYIHGDGVLIYPGEERLHPDQDRGIAGPIATVQLANFRRGLQDHQYLTLARSLGLKHSSSTRCCAAIVPRVFSDAGRTRQLSGDAAIPTKRRGSSSRAPSRRRAPSNRECQHPSSNSQVFQRRTAVNVFGVGSSIGVIRVRNRTLTRTE